MHNHFWKARLFKYTYIRTYTYFLSRTLTPTPTYVKIN